MTIFERIILRQIPADIVFEDDELIAFRDIEPKAPVHILLVPKRHIANINELKETDTLMIGRLVLRASEIARTEGIAESGYRLVINCNRDGGQSVDHVHVHILGGRPMKWPPG